jgi:hypothetical protein
MFNEKQRAIILLALRSMTEKDLDRLRESVIDTLDNGQNDDESMNRLNDEASSYMTALDEAIKILSR